MKMDLRELLLVFTMLWSMCAALRCYKCAPKKDDYKLVELCDHFDYSDKYVTECADSTMCYKREITSTLGNGIKLYQRDCALQIMSGDQQLVNQKWVYVNKIYEPYEEGCKESSQENKVTTTVNCYCRGDFCNSARKKNGGVMTVTVGLLAYLLQ